ncbi:translation initiation factor eIF-2B subunit delta isoform X2 [Zea mays]|uniref:Translation initiation factor eIF2B subunit delta n=3 Tax=Zea mays TaxID=4577 RepID=A0A804LRY5_MAIZE|nr:translation initiation factor eIF-2B subunit delta isoform X2 [Zea mays]XP_008662209.1 translation initiation factor eIF-2B subunit delta isoform X2 [Zea mays]XP_020402125.1 translation initiation factor eIF-2B subunit delta isoform X2 [Zea mays]XP_035820037.1 translation initiation factor eIF-2B subunit delta isoform X2 [Zea mays]XP_035820038.1 translation initiation factor eIF-2B subunit delta isoform X2 [Zea mays]|eukprot:XP_008662208.1 translation initiation factor eIF-2B subunit delta isoform X2 [Zea mays]
MDIRRGPPPPRTASGGVEPRFRQVGFVTAAEPARGAATPAPASPAASDGLSPVMIPPPLIPVPVPVPVAPASESLAPSSPPPDSSSRPDAVSDLDDDDDIDVSWARPPPPAFPEPNKRHLTERKNEHAPPTPVSQKPKLSKAERRAIQESQRAAKAAAKEAGLKSTAMASDANTKQPKTAKISLKKDVNQVNSPVASDKKTGERPPDKDRKKDAPQPRMQFDDTHRVVKAKKRSVVRQSEAQNRVELFRHLPQYAHGTQLPDLESKFFQPDLMHPSVYKVGLQYLSGDISGGNARCIAMLLAFREAINDYSMPSEKILNRDLTAKISSYVSFLIECRPLSISMGNAIRFLKNRITKLPLAFSESEAKVSLQSDIDRFINEKIIVADKVIVSHAVTKIRDGDVLLTFGSASVVEMIFDNAHELGKKFRVVVVDSRPNHEGQGLLRRLVAKGISCTYTHINAVSYIMHEVTRVFLGASSVLSNGTVYSRVGTALVAMVAHAFGVPVLVCCEAYKFHERVQLDSICFNELGDPDAISRVPRDESLSNLKNWAENENLHLLNLKYDITPSDYVSMLITDYGMLPPTSVPVIVREYRREHVWI